MTKETSAQDTTLHRQLAEVEAQIAEAEAELADLDAGKIRLRRDDGLVVEAELDGEEFRLGDQAEVLAALGYDRDTATRPSLPDAEMMRGYLPILAITGGIVLLVCAALLLLPSLLTEPPSEPNPSDGSLTNIRPTPTPKPTATSAPTVIPTPSLIPEGLLPRAPAKLAIPSRSLSWDLVKGDWQGDGGSLKLIDYGVNVQYYGALAGVGNVVIGGDGTAADSTLFALRSLDINDVIALENWAGDIFYYRLNPLDGTQLEIWLDPADTWIAQPTNEAIVTLIIRVGNQRMALRGKLYDVKPKKGNKK